MNIYLSNETNFERNGVGFLNDLISAKVTESLNGDYILEIEYPIDGLLSEYLVEDNILKCNVGNENYQLFRIKQVTKDFTTIKIYALHISYDLLNNMLLNVAPTNQSCVTFGQWILDNTQLKNNFTFESDITNVKSARYVRKNPIEAIMGTEDNSMINLFGGELERDNFKIKMLSNRGSNNGIKLIFGKNIKSIKITIDITSLYTRLMPIGFDGLMLPEIYVDSPIINDYYTPKISTVEFSNIKYTEDTTDESAYHDVEEAYQALRNACFNLYEQGIDKPNINIKIDWLELSNTKQYRNQYANLETARLGDIITANILGLDYTTKVTKTVYNVLTKSIDKFEIGTLQQTISNTVNNTQKELEKVNVTSILKSATENATSLITTAMGGYVYKTQSELYIMDTDDPTTAQKVWRWNINGLGYSNTGINGQYGIAMTMDGSINANFITAGTISANILKDLTLLLSENNISIDSPNLKIDSLGNLECLNAILRGGNLVLEDDGSGENASIKIKTTKKVVKDIDINLDLNDSYLYQNFGENFNFEEAVGQKIFTTDKGYIVELQREIVGSSSHTIGYNHKVVITNNSDYEETIYEVFYNQDEDTFTTNINIIEFELPAEFGKVTTINSSTYLPYIKKLLINAGLTTYSSQGMEASIYSNYKYTREDYIKVQKYILGQETLTSEEIVFYDTNNDGKVTLPDLIVIGNNGGQYNVSDNQPGKLIIDTTGVDKNLQILDKDGNEIVTLGITGSKVMTLNHPVFPDSYNQIDVGESLTYRKTQLETICGTWIDGKKIYRQVIPVDSFEQSTLLYMNLSGEINEIIKIDGMLNISSARLPVNLYVDSTLYTHAYYRAEDSAIVIHSGWAVTNGHIIVEYTKR